MGEDYWNSIHEEAIREDLEREAFSEDTKRDIRNCLMEDTPPEAYTCPICGIYDPKIASEGSHRCSPRTLDAINGADNSTNSDHTKTKRPRSVGDQVHQGFGMLSQM